MLYRMPEHGAEACRSIDWRLFWRRHALFIGEAEIKFKVCLKSLDKLTTRPFDFEVKIKQAWPCDHACFQFFT